MSPPWDVLVSCEVKPDTSGSPRLRSTATYSTPLSIAARSSSSPYPMLNGAERACDDAINAVSCAAEAAAGGASSHRPGS
jgi:hypothetical protein